MGHAHASRPITPGLDWMMAVVVVEVQFAHALVIGFGYMPGGQVKGKHMPPDVMVVADLHLHVPLTATLSFGH